MLTNNQLVQLYLSFHRDFTELSAGNSDYESIRQLLTQRLNNSFYHVDSSLYHAAVADQQKARHILNTYLDSQANKMRAGTAVLPPPYGIVAQHPAIYCLRKEGLFNWSQLEAFMSYKMYSSPQRNLGVKALVGAALLYVLGLLKIVLTGIALYYIVNQTLNSMERFIYNEGWQQAAITLASIAAGAAAGAILGVVIASMPFIWLGAASLITIASLSILGAALSCGLTSWAQSTVLAKNNTAALDPEDPFRFTLTAEEEQNLIQRQIDPLKVLCAITALRMEMGSEGAASFLGRMFRDKHQTRHQNLMLIRQIRSGDLDQVMIGEQFFDLRNNVQPPQPYAELYPPMNNHFQENYFAMV